MRNARFARINGVARSSTLALDRTNHHIVTDVMEFQCRTCGETHEGLPAWHFEAPVQALAIPEHERRSRVQLTEDDCIIDNTEFYLKGLLELPVHGVTQSFTWGVWLSVSEESYQRFAQLFVDHDRAAGEEFFGWLCNSIPSYPETQLLKTMLHVREYPLRPTVELEPTQHPLASDHRTGVSQERAIAMAERLLHAPEPGKDASRPAI